MDPWLGIGLHDYVALRGAEAALGLPAMLGHYRLTPAQWEHLGASWNARIAADPRCAQHAQLVAEEAGRIRAGGAPRPVVPPAPQAFAPVAANPFGSPQQQQAFDREASDAASQIGAAFAGIGSAMESLFTNAVMTVGSRVMVQWSDGHRYPATVTAIHGGQVQVSWPNGQQFWVPQHAVSIT